jgi:hypothetical protein
MDEKSVNFYYKFGIYTGNEAFGFLHLLGITTSLILV